MSDPAQRIIGHMNADHHLSLIDYVIYYGKVDESILVENSVGISSIDSERVVIDYKTTNSDTFNHFTLKWTDAVENQDIPVKNLTDLRPKLVAMAEYAAAKRGYSHQQIKKVVLPGPKQFLMYVAFAILMMNSYDPLLLSRLLANDWLFNTVVAFIPQGVKNFYLLTAKHAARISVATYIIHIIEILIFTLPFLKKYRVPLKQRLAWIFMHFFEGYLVISRLKELAKSSH